MSDQESADKEQRKKTIIAAAFLVIAAGLLWYNFWPGPRLSTSKAYFTDDDGKTWFADSVDNIPPFAHNGKEAVKINLYRTEKNSTPFAGFLMKFPQNVKESIERESKQKTPPKAPHEIAYSGEMPNQMLVKAPGKGDWQPLQSPAGVKAMTVTSPDSTELDSVVPTD